MIILLDSGFFFGTQVGDVGGFLDQLVFPVREDANEVTVNEESNSILTFLERVAVKGLLILDDATDAEDELKPVLEAIFLSSCPLLGDQRFFLLLAPNILVGNYEDVLMGTWKKKQKIFGDTFTNFQAFLFLFCF